MSISHFIKHFINIRMTFQFFHINGKFAGRGGGKKWDYETLEKRSYTHPKNVNAAPSGKDICHSHTCPFWSQSKSLHLSQPPRGWAGPGHPRPGCSSLGKVHSRFRMASWKAQRLFLGRQTRFRFPVQGKKGENKKTPNGKCIHYLCRLEQNWGKINTRQPKSFSI